MKNKRSAETAIWRHIRPRLAEVGHEGTLQGDDLEIVTRLQREVIDQGIDVKTVRVEGL